MAPPFEFVITDPVSNPKPGKSLQVRSRCMQGKNKIAGSRRSQREKRRLAKEKEVAAPQTQQPTAPVLPPLSTPISALGLVRFADSMMSVKDKGMVLKAFAHNVPNQVLSPLERWVDFDSIERVPFDWLFTDAAFLHTVLCASYAIEDTMVSNWDGKPGPKTVFHMRETLSHLQIKLCNEQVHLDESLLQVIIELALLGAMFDDWHAAAVHYKGLQRIVQLRGKLEFLRARPKFYFRLDRIDLVWTLQTGNKLLNLDQSVSQDPIMPALHSPLPEGLYQPCPEWDTRLRNIFRDMQYFTLKINHDVRENARCSASSFQGNLTSLQSRLAHLADVLENPVEELVRLTMMAYLTTTFNNPARKVPYDWVKKQLKDVQANAAGGLTEQDMNLRRWMLIVIAATITGAQESWVKTAWATVGLGLDWAVLKPQLKRVMWIEIIHDRPGEMVFGQLET